MRAVLVTGASGFLGWHVAKQLMEKGERVRALVRKTSRALDLDGVELATGDLRDRASLDSAVAGCKSVYHVAADYRLWSRHPRELYDSNIQGTRNLMEAAWSAGVEQLVYTSTVGCIGIPPGRLGDESAPVSLEEMSGHYKRSKFLAERAALDEAAQGKPVWIVNPTAPVGDRDVRPTPTGKVILDFMKGEMPAYIDTGLNLIGARDTARGHLLAAERGKPGERYILGGENLTLAQIFDRLSPIVGRPAPRLRIPYAVAYAAAAASTAWAGVTGREPRAPLEGVRMAKKKMWVSTDKAARELGFTAEPVDGALRRAVEWFRENGYC